MFPQTPIGNMIWLSWGSHYKFESRACVTQWWDIDIFPLLSGRTRHLIVIFQIYSTPGNGTLALVCFFIVLLQWQKKTAKKKSPVFFTTFWVVWSCLASLGGDLTLYKYRYILFSCCQMTQKILAKCPWRWRWLAIVVLKIIFLKKQNVSRDHNKHCPQGC